MNLLLSFFDVFYVDATSEETIQTDLETIAPGKAKRTVDASLRWLASQTDRNWLLVFDNADNVDLKLKDYFPSCSSGNIIITTRNRELRHYTAKDADADVKGMDLEDAKKLLLVQARAESNIENDILAETIVQVVAFTVFFNRGFHTHTPGRSSIALRWLSPKLVPSFTATRLYVSIENSTSVNVTICCKIRRLKDRIRTNQLCIQHGN